MSYRYITELTQKWRKTYPRYQPSRKEESFFRNLNPIQVQYICLLDGNKELILDSCQYQHVCVCVW